MPILDLSFQSILARILAATVVATLLGAFLALVADQLGDHGPKFDGRLTSNPVAHTSLWSLVATTAMLAGWTKLLTLEPTQDSCPAARPIIVALCGEAALIAFGLGIGQLSPVIAAYWPQSSSAFALTLVRTLREASFGFALLNLLPLPPLLGGYILQYLAPSAFDSIARRSGLTSLVIAEGGLSFHALVSSNPIAWIEASI
ncbi:hypothetical protein [Pelagibacterium xiamenense]|uniref:hypothetical protein n=1 Tax=Pelagibacterium xiamenense TaxID=2901140 RepID=UPI001E59F2F8|nr:hypothetical protein [Pelagibacterium xiamenense]MCD7059572.1 hypothetical protein [Pelagibacterium xiamenense]